MSDGRMPNAAFVAQLHQLTNNLHHHRPDPPSESTAADAPAASVPAATTVLVPARIPDRWRHIRGAHTVRWCHVNRWTAIPDSQTGRRRPDPHPH